VRWWPWVSRERLDDCERRARIAEDRLYGAWKEGAQIPPRAAVEPTVKEVRLLPEKVLRFVQNWEDPQTRADLEREARVMLEQGLSEERIVAVWEARQGDGRREE
jgi:hypothetical protein